MSKNNKKPKRRNGIAWGMNQRFKDGSPHKDKRPAKFDKFIEEEMEAEMNSAFEPADPDDIDSIWWDS